MRDSEFRDEVGRLIDPGTGEVREGERTLRARLKGPGGVKTELTVECPTCQGETVIRGLAHGPDGCQPGELPCFTCGGTGSITAERSRWIAFGGVMKETRRRAQISVRVAAAALGLDPRELSAAERGDVDPMPIFDRHVEVYKGVR